MTALCQQEILTLKKLDRLVVANIAVGHRLTIGKFLKLRKFSMTGSYNPIKYAVNDLKSSNFKS